MPLRPAAILAFVYALGYPIGALAVSSMTPMATLVCRFGLAALILTSWTLLAGVKWPTGRTLGHVMVAGLLTQALQFICLYLALMHGAPAVLGAVIVSMNPVATALLAAVFLGERLTARRVAALVLGVIAVLAACAGRLLQVGGVDIVVGLLIVSLLAIAAGGVYQQRFCHGVDFRAAAALQNAASLVPVAILAAVTPFHVTNVHTAVFAVGAVVLLNATLCMTLYVRAIDRYGAAAVAMLFAVIPAVAGVLSWLILGQRPDFGIVIGLVVGALACWLNAKATSARPARSTLQPQTAGSSRSGPSDRHDREAECPCP
ncbi:DMT family transporter [Mycobacterium sp. OTB74]|jgi:drug/metabolite transporter (DMT)-like permease|uniref:DMT family transporter n=1 Tax=Mycobacterium sp. OTB74 TaxID=1853452 RepID=UPI00247353C1|nr:DMT family transporter [Mycobacterium sp. OTB74]MDH6245006.1 drug/metabolite transporter (DMT)-like permease [Mycobacterium sp. OTB74]